MRQTYIVYGAIVLTVLLQGCIGLNNDGISCDDDAAGMCGIAGLIAFIVAIAGKNKSGGLAIAGIILLIA